MEELDALLEELEHSTLQESDEYFNTASPSPDQHSRKEKSLADISIQDDTSSFPVQLVYTTKIQEPNVYSEVQNPKESPPPPKTSAAAQLDELMARLCDMQTKVTVKADASKKHLPHQQDQKASLDSMLGGLEQELQDLGIATVSKGHCASCQKPIAGKVIHALGQAWHPEHFVCAHCRQEVGSSPFFERSGLAYCPKDYHHLFSPRCAYCAAPILEKVLTAMNQTWHPEHFFCAHCGEVFGAEGFHEKDQKPYCRKDFLAMFSPKCGGCNRPVLENYLSAMDTVWHPECFVCGVCMLIYLSDLGKVSVLLLGEATGKRAHN
ncbi:Leupaxin [Camelus dromedarius]|uniref:Leupaxin n=1 Tax=Camelus dromedarius TaxID=9838 RepID=A0A5N4DLK9_CAMDR|nr:leupaxin isoform 1 [Camelus ferus]KAB1271939.1 Leupaxin [Camelus dromedarius]